MKNFDALFTALKREALPAVWSQGVKLSREGTLLLESQSEDRIVVRVSPPGRSAYSTAVVYPEDAEWTCDCPGPADPCQHVVAAGIQLRHAPDGAASLPGAAAAPARLRYELRRLPHGGMTVDRYVRQGDGDTRIDGTLTAAQSKFPIHPGPGDLAADRIINAAHRGLVRAEMWQPLLEALSDATVTLEGRPIAVSSEPLLPRARVFDEGAAVVLTIEKHPQIDAVLAGGVGRAGDTVRPLGLTELTGLRLERLPLIRRFEAGDLGQLVSEVLPELEAKLELSVDSTRLPKQRRGRELPRIHFEIDNAVHTLSVLPLLVYGDPPRARVDAGKLVHLSGDLPTRDEREERELSQRLRSELNLMVGRRASFNGVDATRFASKLQDFQRSLRSEGALPLVRARALVPQVSAEEDDFEIRFLTAPEHDAESGAEPARPEQVSADVVLRAWQDGLSLVPLSDGGWAPLPSDWLARHGERVLDLLAARDAEGRIGRAAIPALAALCDALEQPRPPSFARLAPLLTDFQAIPPARLPSDLTAALRPYQQRGVDWLVFLRDAGLGAVLADDMGLGKTLQTLCAVQGKVLVVCPKSVVFNWEAEARRFRPGLKTCLYHGPDRRLDPEADLTITTYAILRLDQERLSLQRWTCAVLDEAQAIKNPDSQVARAAYELPADFRLALTGTPLENRLEELWSLMHFTNRGLLGGRSDFRERFALPIEQGDGAKLGVLREKTRPFVLRRLKRVVAPELPPRSDVVLDIELEPEERELYSAVHAATRRDVLAKLEAGGGVMQALEALLRLRQAACHPALLPGRHAERSSKVTALIERLSELTAEGHKALVFSQWTSLLDLLEPELRQADVGFARLDGSTRDRAGVVERFQSDQGPPVLITSLKAGGSGLNLTAADHVFLLDPWWNPAAEDQAADRAHRIGQSRPVMVYRLIARHTVEERILELQQRKRALAEAALDGSELAAGITKDDLLLLLQ